MKIWGIRGRQRLKAGSESVTLLRNRRQITKFRLTFTWSLLRANNIGSRTLQYTGTPLIHKFLFIALQGHSNPLKSRVKRDELRIIPQRYHKSSSECLVKKTQSSAKKSRVKADFALRTGVFNRKDKPQRCTVDLHRGKKVQPLVMSL